MKYIIVINNKIRGSIPHDRLEATLTKLGVDSAGSLSDGGNGILIPPERKKVPEYYTITHSNFELVNADIVREDTYSLNKLKLIEYIKDTKDKDLMDLLENPAKTDPLGYSQQLADALAFPSTDANVLRRINNRLKAEETPKLWVDKVLNLKSIYYTEADSLATGLQRRTIDAIESLELAGEWEEQLDNIMKNARLELKDIKVTLTSFYANLKETSQYKQ